jgi:hypothetical protein
VRVLQEPRERILGAIEQAALQVVLPEFGERLGTRACGKVGTVQQVRVNAHGAVELAAAPEQVAERVVQFDRLGIELDHLDERIDRLVVLVVQEQVQATEVRARQTRLVGRMRARLEATRKPPGAEQQRQREQVPELELDHARSPAPSSATAPDCRAALSPRSAMTSGSTTIGRVARSRMTSRRIV